MCLFYYRTVATHCRCLLVFCYELEMCQKPPAQTSNLFLWSNTFVEPWKKVDFFLLEIWRIASEKKQSMRVKHSLKQKRDNTQNRINSRLS